MVQFSSALKRTMYNFKNSFPPAFVYIHRAKYIFFQRHVFTNPFLSKNSRCALSMVQNISKIADHKNIIAYTKPEFANSNRGYKSSTSLSIWDPDTYHSKTLGSFPDVQPTNSALILTFLLGVSNNIYYSETLVTK